ncbi:hypothetical protein P171DRAFT_358179 [Karstenula rhodostoma CBS 690.94]|uniref:Uncharacterized protein n=1 Tax=Karstenula rhodostoma CBS 690.94 TaxID=1392251 RepID=A0A9P4UCQ2_9PLEO|nr:hypothetical protein P171DRAFT_358179 [Karstenula rhodostoma CBS 690.94]
MPPLPGFSDNPFRTRMDLIRAAIALIKPLNPYKSPTRARITLATSTAAGFSETAAQLEGFSRPLWVVAFLLSSQATQSDPAIQTLLSDAELNLASWVQGLKEGTDPQSPEYWGDLGPSDQRMVEMETIAIALLVHPSAFSFSHDPPARGNLIRWLRQINAHAMPQNNWLFFRVLVNLALVLSLGVPLGEVKSHIDGALEVLDSFYIGDGWSSDGVWGAERKQADYYAGSFAMQFCALLFVKHAAALPAYAPRIEKYEAQAREFAKEYWRYFDADGAAIPFGRSLTYRYACAAFWAAVSYAGIEMAAPVDVGAVKGLLLRHLRWWSRQPHTFNTDGTHNIGYTYPNMYLSENYNSPQSPYWSLKSFLVLGLSSSSSFWSAGEQPHPLAAQGREALSRVKVVWPPRQLLVSAPEHHFLLSAGQSTSKPFKAREAKYGKFAYSSAFAFSVPTGPLLDQLAPDSTIAVYVQDGEEEGWKVRWEPYGVETGSVSVGGGYGYGEATFLRSTWRPWKRRGVRVETTLIAPGERWPGWHVRVHRIYIPRSTAPLRVVDGGFAVDAQTARDSSIFETRVCGSFDGVGEKEREEGWWNDGRGALVVSRGGASGVVDLTSSFSFGDAGAEGKRGECVILRADPNTNIIASRTLIPMVQHSFAVDGGDNQGDAEAVFCVVTGVFAIQASAEQHLERVWELWGARPSGAVDGGVVRLG